MAGNGNRAFVDSVAQEIIQPGIQRLMDSRYFSELREGKLSTRRLQGWALQHYLHNHTLLKGFALCMVKNAQDPDLYKYFQYQFNEEQYHPDLAKTFGLALGLEEKDFESARPIFECLAHTGKAIRGMLVGSPAENRTSALVDESTVRRYSQEFNTYLRKHYGLGDKALQFFLVHQVADEEHTEMAAQIIARYTRSARDEELVRDTARTAVRFKLAKFEGIYEAYA